MNQLMRTGCGFVLILLMAMSAKAEYRFTETINDTLTLRATEAMTGPGNADSWSATFPGNSQFSEESFEINYFHSIKEIAPAILPDGTILTARLKLWFIVSNRSEISVSVDSLSLENLHRRIFFVGPFGHDSVDVQTSSFGDGWLKIDIEASQGPFTIRQSQLEVTYLPSMPTNVTDSQSALPHANQLNNNYPNPFNPSTSIDYFLSAKSQVKVAVYNSVGRQVKQLVNKTESAGKHTVVWDGTDDNGTHVSTGVYLYRIETENYQESKKMVLLK